MFSVGLKLPIEILPYREIALLKLKYCSPLYILFMFTQVCEWDMCIMFMFTHVIYIYCSSCSLRGLCCSCSLRSVCV